MTLEKFYVKLLKFEGQESLHDEEAAAAMLAAWTRRYCSY